MDEQENGKIGFFNYVHFLFSIATSEKDKKKLEASSLCVTTLWEWMGLVCVGYD